jgi:hypothetical protein
VTGARLLDQWSPPEGAGAPVACLATTFTFDADFFAQDCLARFLSLSTVASEGDRISSIVALLEEEDRLSEARVCVLIDHSSPAEKRNLRWDVLPVRAPGGLLHAKVAVLLWARATRVILGSANLTPAGYRRQVEVALALDLNEGCKVPRTVADSLIDNLRRITELAPGPTVGAKERALATLGLLADRVAALGLPATNAGGVRLAIAPARPGVCPVDRLPDVWRGGQPLRATVLSPFWDDAVPAPAIVAVGRQLSGRPASRRSTRLVVGVDPLTGRIQAPPSLAAQPGTEAVVFDTPDAGKEYRHLHAKVLLFESDDWLAAMIGSSNATTEGYGLDLSHGHHELNLWIGCPAGSRTAQQLHSLTRASGPLETPSEEWNQDPDEDEPTTPTLPLGFDSCLIIVSPQARLRLGFGRPASLPEFWEVHTPAGHQVLTVEAWHNADSPRVAEIALPDAVLPAYLDVHWQVGREKLHATWTANVEDRAALPPPAELTGLPVDLLLAALSSTRPLPLALEDELRRREGHAHEGNGVVELDPLRRFDSSGLLLQRARRLSLALWRLQHRLSRPATSIDALTWRLRGVFGPAAIADGVVAAAHAERLLPGESHFMLAELALTVSAIDWRQVAPRLDKDAVGQLVAGLLSHIEEQRRALPPPAPDPALERYAREALAAARR